MRKLQSASHISLDFEHGKKLETGIIVFNKGICVQVKDENIFKKYLDCLGYSILSVVPELCDFLGS